MLAGVCVCVCVCVCVSVCLCVCVGEQWPLAMHWTLRAQRQRVLADALRILEEENERLRVLAEERARCPCCARAKLCFGEGTAKLCSSYVVPV